MKPPRLPLRALALLLALAAGAAAQSDRFAGWDRLVDPGFRFDPDERAILGFSVRTSTAARNAFDEVERAFAEGDARAAGLRLLEILRRHPEHVVQVGGGTGGPERWVGAAEWACYQLERRVPESVRAELASADDRAVLEQALAWRDTQVLRRLAVELEPLPEGRRARAALVRLLREAGHAREARAVGRESEPASPGPEPEPALIAPGGPRWARLLAIEQLSRAVARATNPFPGSSRSVEAPFAPVRPLVDAGVVYVSDSISLRAYDLVSGREHWAAPGPIERATFTDEDLGVFDYSVYGQHKRERAINPFQIAQPVLAGERLLVTLQVGEPRYPLDAFDGHPINYPLPRRRLRAHDPVTGELLWTQERPALGDEAFVNRFDAVGPPVVLGDRVWVSGSVREGALSAWAVSFDLATGELRSRTLLCTGQQELTMFNRPFHEHLVSPLREHEGALYVSTNLGVVGCVDAFTGRPRWLASYEPIPREGAVRMSSISRDVYWMNDPPFVFGDTLVVAPLDSESLLGLERTTGRRKHTTLAFGGGPRYRGRPVRHQVLPLDEERMLLVTEEGVECRDAVHGTPIWTHRPFFAEGDVEVTGRAVLHDDELLVPTDDALLVVDPESGAPRGSRAWPEGDPYGPPVQVVTPAEHALVLSDGRSVQAVVDAEAVRAGLASGDAPDPRDRLRRAELELLEGRTAAALARFTELASEPHERALAERARSGRLAAALALARAEGGADAWSTALAACDTPQRLLEHAPEVLDALARAGRDGAVLAGLERLDAVAPDAELALAGEAPQSVRVLRARFGLERLDPAAQVALLQDLVELDPPSVWNGRTVAEEARRRQGALLADHGPALYAVQERAAELALERGEPLEEVARRYAHARPVRAAQRERLRALLDQGRAEEVLLRTVGSTDEVERGLRLAAAEQLGETAYAALLRGEPPAPLPLPRLPAADTGGVELPLHPSEHVELQHLTGRAAPHLAGFVPGYVETEGTLFALDTARGEVAWSGRALPGGRRRLSRAEGFHVEGEALVLRAGYHVDGVGLADGRELWSDSFGGTPLESTAGVGLFLTLQRISDDRVQLVAHTIATGKRAFVATFDDARDAHLDRVGRHALIAIDAARDRPGVGRQRRLVVLDLATGGVLHQLPLDHDLDVVGEHPHPPRALFAGRLGTTSRLLGFDPMAGEWLWESEVPVARLSRERVFADGAGGHVVVSDAQQPATRSSTHRLHRVDPDRGLLPAAPLPPLRLVPVEGAPEWSPRLVLRNPDLEEHFLVVDTRDLRPVRELRFQPGEIDAPARILQGAEGFVLLSDDGRMPMKVSLRVVRGSERYSVALGDSVRSYRPQVAVVDGAVVVAAANAVRVVRSDEP